MDCNCSSSKLMFDSSKSDEKTVGCSFFCSKLKLIPSPASGENADAIQVTVLSNQSRINSTSSAPTTQYLPAPDPARALIVNYKLDVLCYASKDFPIAFAISQLIVPGLADQIISMKNAFKPKLLEQHPRLSPYHFIPPGYLHPVAAIYDHQYGETEVAQVEIRKSLHERLMLPLDRPLLRIANALSFSNKGSLSSNLKSSTLLKDVHTDIPSSGVSGGHISLIDGSYEYYHYLLDGIDDNDCRTGDWLLFHGEDTVVGYWPKTLFTGLAGVARNFEIGDVAGFIKGNQNPPMGSGHFPDEGAKLTNIELKFCFLEDQEVVWIKE